MTDSDRIPGTDASRLAALFAEARRAVAFTGAGVSTESGIADFRSHSRRRMNTP